MTVTESLCSFGQKADCLNDSNLKYLSKFINTNKEPVVKSDHTRTNFLSRQLEQLENELHNKQMQLNCLMKITKAINANVSASGLFTMYSDFLNEELGVGKLAMFFKEDKGWICKKAISFDKRLSKKLIEKVIGKFTDFSKIGELSEQPLKQFEFIIPVLHKDDPIAYVLVGNIAPSEDAYDRIKFMITITNVVAVAIENKRLFNQQLEQEGYHKELELAQRVQQMFIPSKLPKEHNYELSAIYRPHSNVGGDYFDFLKLDNGFIICLADVSGKGVPAALVMANFQATLRNAAMIFSSLDDLVRHINKSVITLTKGERIVTFFILRFNSDQGKIEYVNAGHNPPIMITEGKIHLLTRGCTLLGAVEEIEMIDVGMKDIEQDTLILLFTDGLTDLRNGNGKHFDEKMIGDFALKYQHKSAVKINEKLLSEIETFKGKQNFPDDIAVLTCKIRSSGLN